MKKAIIILGLVLISSLILIGCAQKYVCSNGKRVDNPSQCDVCGDNECTGQETNCNCPKDCGPSKDGLKVRKQCSEAAPLWDTQSGACVAVGKDNCL